MDAIVEATTIIKEVHNSCEIPKPSHSNETSNPVKLATVATVIHPKYKLKEKEVIL
tara:strand:- start:273 stop:440 length:168 start_codon:yes stop_codon:yes gene_type:complete